MKKIVLGLFSLVFVCMLFGSTSVMAQDKDLSNSERLVKVSAELSSYLRILQKEGVISGRHPNLKEMATKKYEEVWNTLTIDEQKQVVELRIEGLRERISHAISSLSFYATRFPYKGLGVRFDISTFDAFTSGIPVVVDKIFKEGPAVGLLKPFDFILAVNEIRLDDFLKREAPKLEKPGLMRKLEKYRVKFLDAIKNSADVVKLEIKRSGKKITVNVEKALIGKWFPSKIKALENELRDKELGFLEALKNAGKDLDTVSEEIVKSKFEEAFLVGFQDIRAVMKKYEEVVFQQTE